jgi:hypothetical protein
MLLELLCIILRTKDKDYFLNCDDYSAVTDAEVETLLQQSREAVLSLQTELESRQKIRFPMQHCEVLLSRMSAC